LASALSSKDSDELQRKADPFVTVLVTINPEARVKVQRGPLTPELSAGWPIPLLIKVINEGGVTGYLDVRAEGDSKISAWMYEYVLPTSKAPKLMRKLSGRSVEYQVALVRSTALGRHEIKLSFDVGKQTQDLGFRAELPLLIHTSVGAHPFYEDKNNLLFSLHADGTKHSIKSVSDWLVRRNDIVNNFKYLAGMNQDSDSVHTVAVPLVHVLEEVALDKVIRQKIDIRITETDRLPGYLLIPKQLTGKNPAILCLHQTTKIGKAEPAGLGGLPHLHYALELAERGYITLAPDYPGFGDYTGCNPYALGFRSATAKGIRNHQAAIDFLATLPQVDAEKIGCIGHSLGGHNTLYVSLLDSRIKVLASSCGFCAAPKYYGGNIAGWTHKGYMPRIPILYQNKPSQLPVDFPEMLTALAPRPVFINAPLHDDNFAVDGVRDCVKAALPVYQLFGKPEHLVVEHPDCGHDFPADVRERCYQFFDKYLRSRQD
jgi:dienelactone hydrolase